MALGWEEWWWSTGVHTCNGRECVAIGKELSSLTDWCF